MWKLFRIIDNKHKSFAIMSALFTFFQVLTDLIVPSMLTTLVMIIGNNKNPNNEWYVSIIYKDWRINMGSANEALTLCAILMVGFSVLGIIFGMLSSFLASKVAVEISRVTRNNLFKKIQTLSASNISKFGTSSLITRLTNDVTQVQTLAILMLRLMIRAPFLFIGGLVFSLLTDLKLSITLGIMIPLMLMIVAYFAIKVLPLFSKNQKIVDQVNQVSRENILGIRVIKSFNLEHIQEEKFNKVNDDWLRVSTKAFSIMNIMIPIVMLVTNLAMVILAIIGKTMFEPNDVSLAANIAVFMQYLGYVTGGLLLTVMVLVILLRSRVSAIRINQVMDEKPDIVENKSNNFIDKANVKFKNVSFKFNKDSENVLTNISFSLKEGETLGIIGPTGSGKSTIVNLLSRIYEPDEGVIEIDNKKISDINTINLNDSIGQVFQESVLFAGTIKSNLLFGKKDATKQEIDKATRIACANEFIESFNDKLDHIVEQRGKNLSGGQKQRLQIARAVIRNPKILVLDDSTSALDAMTDKKLRNNLKKEMSKTTKIIIAQKINSIKDADKIIVLDKGKMVGYGKHKDLIEGCSLYKEIAKSQLSKEELENV